jgi:hypothetical protein
LFLLLLIFLFPTYKVDMLSIDEFMLFINVSSWIRSIMKDYRVFASYSGPPLTKFESLK